MTTEPVGNDSWMPLNNHPLAKPTYDIYDTTNIGKVAIGPGELVGYTAPVGTTYQPVPAPASNPPDANFPARLGDLALALAGADRELPRRELDRRLRPLGADEPDERRPVLGGAGGPRSRRRARRLNKIAMDNQEDIVNFQQIFNGPWALTTDGVVVGTPPASFEEEMQGKITFAGGTIGGATGTSLGHAQPREHAPVVRRQRRRGRVQPHVVEGGLRDPRRVPLHGADDADRLRPGRPRRERRRVRARA